MTVSETRHDEDLKWKLEEKEEEEEREEAE
jgi:hypothetical protein